MRQGEQKTREGRDGWGAEVGTGEAVGRDVLEDGEEGKHKRI